jgi:hypothetical protein
MHKFTKKTLAVSTAAALLLGGGAAYAYWTTTGSGTGSATAGTTATFTVASVTTGDALSPNGPTQTAAFTITNPGSGAQQVKQVVVSILKADGSAWNGVAGCSADDYSVGGGAAGVPKTIDVTENLAAGATSAISHSVTIRMIDDGTEQDGCKGVTAPLHYAVS